MRMPRASAAPPAPPSNLVSIQTTPQSALKKTQVAFQMSAERLAERGRLYLWTFTFAKALNIADTRERWNHLLTLLRRRWPKLCGLRVFEMHRSHGLHVHLLTDGYLDVNAARSMANKAGWGRIHVERIPASKAGYLGKYLSKERPPCFKGWRLWAAFGKDWDWTKVGHLEKYSAFSRVYRHLKSACGWEGNQGFFQRADSVLQAVSKQIKEAKQPPKNPPSAALRQAFLGNGAVLVL